MCVRLQVAGVGLNVSHPVCYVYSGLMISTDLDLVLFI
jgi:hypothetical protein